MVPQVVFGIDRKWWGNIFIGISSEKIKKNCFVIKNKLLASKGAQSLISEYVNNTLKIFINLTRKFSLCYAFKTLKKVQSFLNLL